MKAQPPAIKGPGFVMIVDDEPENLNVLEVSLSHAGYRVALFPRGDLAFSAAYEEQPDLVLLDISMPEMDGHEVCRRFKADPRLKTIPILFISARSSIKDITLGFECGGADYITKPFKEAEVLARVHTHIALKRAYTVLAEQHNQLRLLERNRDMLVLMMVHDLRSPLQVILSSLETLENSATSGLHATYLGRVRASIHATRCLTRMVSTVVDISRMETDGIPLNQQSVPVRNLFTAACAQAFAPDSTRVIAEHIAESCPHLLCDVDLSVRIVTNLLANAVKHTPANTQLTLGAEPGAGGVRLWIKDLGPGIPAQYHQLIFEKFGTLDLSKDQYKPSTGLGLAFCKLAVEAQGGTIGVESEPGKGSTFWFILPAAAPSLPA